MRCALSIATITLALVGCATPYQPMGAAGGFSEQKLGADTYFVVVGVNGYTDPSVLKPFTLRRAAEIAKSNGYRWFRVVDERVYRQGPGWQSESTVKLLSSHAPHFDHAYEAEEILKATSNLVAN